MTTGLIPMANFALVDSAIRSAWRRSATGKHGVVRALASHLFTRSGRTERVRVDASNTLTTAAWCTEAVPYGTRHHIQLGRPAVDGIDQPKAKASHRLQLAFLRQLLRHETAHARFTLTRTDGTQMTMDELRTLITDAGVPWSLWNLFEDARIEARQRTLDSGELFRWGKWWTFTDTDDPTRYLWTIIQHEAALPTRVCRWTGAPMITHPDSGMSCGTASLIHDFWTRALACTDTAALIPLMQEWIRVFGAACDSTLRTYSDQSPVERLGAVGYAAGSGVDTGTAPTPTSYTTFTREHKSYNRMQASVEYFGSHPLSGKPLAEQGRRYHVPEHAANVQAVMQTFRRIAGVRNSTRQQLSQMGGRVHAHHAITGEASAFLTQDAKHGQRKVTLVMDMSGSMNHHFTKHGAAFIEAIHNLRRTGQIEATIILSGGGRYAELPMNVAPDAFSFLSATHGCESIAQTLLANRDQLIKSDSVIIYTDGHLTDGEVDAGHWRALGVDLIGACAFSEDDGYSEQRLREEMEHHFARVIIAPNGYQLATRILDYITRR